MRRVFVVLGLLGMMVGLDALKVQSSPSHADPLTLAAIGFVLLAAFALAELGARLSLPKVTGYLLTGVALGPHVADILPTGLVDDLRMFRTLALGLIALSAGVAIDVRALWARGRTLVLTTTAKAVVGTVFVGGSVLALARATDVLGSVGRAEAWALALVFAVLSLGTSPAVAVAVTGDKHSRGPLTDLIVSSAVIKDVLVTVLLAVAVAGASDLMGQAELGAHVLISVGAELGGSVAVGAGVGLLLIICLRHVRDQILLVVGAVVVVAVEVGEVLQLGLLLLFIVAGVAVRNLSPHAAKLQDPLRTFSLPIYIVFFTSLGAGLDLAATWSLLPAAVAVCAARALGYWVSAWVGGRHGGEPEAVRRLAWLGYLPQAEVTLALVLVAASALPEVGASIIAMGTAVVTLNVLLGSVGLGVALDRAGEAGGVATTTGEGDESSRVEDSPRLPAALRRIADATARDLQQSWSAWLRGELDPLARRWIEQVRVEASSNKHVTVQVMERLDRIGPCDSVARTDRLRNALISQIGMLDVLPMSTRVPLEAHHAKVVGDDPAHVRWSKRFAFLGALALGRIRRRTRAVPVRLLARTSLEPRMARAAEETARDIQRFEIRALEVLQRALTGTEYTQEAARDLDALRESFVANVEANIAAAIAAGVREFETFLASAGAPGVSSHPYRYSNVERDVAAAWQRIESDAHAWADTRGGAVATLRFLAHVEHAQHQLVEDIVQDVAAPLDQAFAILERVVDEERRRIGGLPCTNAVGDDDEAWERLSIVTRAVLPKPVLKELRAADNLVRRATSTSAPMSALVAYIDDSSGRIRVVPSLHDLSNAVRPATMGTAEVGVRELKEAQIAGQLLPSLEQALSEVAEGFVQARESAREAAGLVESGFAEADEAKKAEQPDAIAKLAEAVEQAVALLDSVRQGACGAWARQRGEILANVTRLSNRMFVALAEAAAGQRSRVADATTRRGSLRVRARRWLGRARTLLRKWGMGLHFAEAGQAAEDLAHLYRLRAGLEHLDAHGIRALVTEQRNARRGVVPESYARWFTVDPVQDPRLYVANRDVLSTLVQAERAWQADADTGNAILVLGSSGMGKSSTLSVARLKVTNRRVIMLRGAGAGERSIMTALAQLLGTEDSERALSETLRGQRSAILIDDLHHWFAPTTAGVEQFEAFLRLIATTAESTFWIACMACESYEVWNQTIPLQQAFAALPRLRPPDAHELETVMCARHELSGLDLEFPRTLSVRVTERLLRRSPRTTFARALAKESHGSLRRAMELWLAHARTEDETITLRPLHTFGWDASFIRPLPPAVKATLALVVRHGFLDAPTIARCLGATDDDVEQTVRFLVAAGLVNRGDSRSPIYASLRDDLVFALREDGLLAGGES